MNEKINQNEKFGEIEDVTKEKTQLELLDLKENVPLKKEEDPELIKTRKIIEEGGSTREIKKLTPELTDILLKSDKLYLAALDLSGLTEIDENVAEKLVGYKGIWIDLSGLTEIDEGVAKKLSEIKGPQYLGYSHIMLNGLTNINEGVAEALSGFVGTIELCGLTKLNVNVAKAFRKHIGTLTLTGLTDIDADVVRELSGHNGQMKIHEGAYLGSVICINGLKLQNIDEKTIMEFAKYLDIFSDHTGNIKKLVKETISKKLQGLDVTLGFKEGLWLVNFKDWIKKKYGNKTVKFKRDLINKKGSFDKTFVVGDTMLMARDELQIYVPQTSDDKVMEEISEWLNK